MHTLLLVMACLTAAPEPTVVVNNFAEAAKLPEDVVKVRVVMRDHNDATILAAVLKHAPDIKTLELVHPDNGVPAKFELLAKFTRLEHLHIAGDAGLDDNGFAVLGKLSRLKSLRMKLP